MLDANDGRISADPTGEDLTSEEWSMLRPDAPSAAALPQSASCFTKARRLWFKSPKNPSPKKERELLRTLRCPGASLFICRQSTISACHVRYQVKSSA